MSVYIIVVIFRILLYFRLNINLRFYICKKNILAMYNMFQQLRLFAYNQLLSKRVSSTKIDDVEGKDVLTHNSKNKVLQEISANLEESERILLDKATISCRDIKSKSDTDIKDSSKTILDTAKKCLSLSDLKKHIACMNIKNFTRTYKVIIKPNSSSGDSEKKPESIKSYHQRHRKHVATDESPSSCDVFGFYKNRRRKRISPYELYVQSVKPVISKNLNKLKKCGSKVIRSERGAKHIPLPSSHHALKVITSNHTKMKAVNDYEHDVFDFMECFENRGEPNYKLSLTKQDHKKKIKLPSRNESIMCHLTENYKHKHHSKKKRKVHIPRSVQQNYSVDVACGKVTTNQSTELPAVTSSTQKLQTIYASADQSLNFPKLITPNQPPKHEFGCSPVPCVSKCECMLNPLQSVIEKTECSTQTSIHKQQYRIRPFSGYLPKSYKNSMKSMENLDINNPNPKSMVKYILICLVVTVWSPILITVGICWLLSYPLRLCFVWIKNIRYNRKKICSCKNVSSCYKPGQTKLQYMMQFGNMQPSQKQNQIQESYAWRTLCCCRRRVLRRSYCVFHADCKTNPLHASQHRVNTITNFFHSVFCVSDNIHQSNVSSFRARRNMVALKNNTLKEPTPIDNRGMHPIRKFSPRTQQNSEAIKLYHVQDKGTTTDPKTKSINLQTYDDQNKSDDDFRLSSFFSPFIKLVENYLVNSKYMTPRQQTFSKNCADGRESKSKYPQRQYSQKPMTCDFKNDGRESKSKYPQRQYSQKPMTCDFKNLRSKNSRGSNKIMDSPQGPFLLSKETKKHDHKKQKVINFADGLLEKKGNCKLSNKNTGTDPLKEQTKRKNLHWKISQTAHETQTNFDKSTQKLIGHCKHSTFNSPRCRSPLNKENKCLQLVSSNCKTPVCDKTKEVNTTNDPDLPLSESTKRQVAYNYTVDKRPTSGHNESLGHTKERKEKEDTTTEINKNKNPGSSNNFLPSVLSEPNKHPLGDDFSVNKSRKKVASPISGHANSLNVTKRANAAVGTDQNSNPSANYDPKYGQSKTNNELTHARSSFLKSSISGVNCLCGTWKKIKKTNVSIGTDQKPQPSESSHKQVHKLTQSSSTSKHPISSCSCGLNGKEAKATVGMNQKSKSNTRCQCRLIKLPYFGPVARLSDCNCPISESTGNVCHCHKLENANTAFETDKKSKSNSSCQCPLNKHPAVSAVCKYHNTKKSKLLCRNCCKMREANTAVETDKKSKSNTGCQCHLLKPTQLPPDLSSFCECPDIANTESSCQNCHKKPANTASKTGQCSELCSSCYFQRSKHENHSRDGLKEGNAASAAFPSTETKSKFSCGERVELNNDPYDFFNATFQQDALNVYKLCPTIGDTNSLKNTETLIKHPINKTATNKYIHTPEYLNVCSDVCGSFGGKKCFAHSLSNNNEKCDLNKQTRTSKCKANSPRNTKNVNNCIRESIEAKQLNSLESPFNDNEYSGKRVTVGCSKSCAKIRGSNESKVYTDKNAKSSWTTRYPCAGTTNNTFCANRHCKMKKEIQAKKTTICDDKNQFCPCPTPCKQRNFSVEERKCCSSQTFKKATFVTPHSISCNEQCKRRKPMRAKYLAYAFYDFISGKIRRKKGNKARFDTQSRGILKESFDCKRQNYETEFQQCYGDSTESNLRNINTALCPISNLKTGGRKNYKNKSMEFNYFTMLKDLIDSKTLQKGNVSAQCSKKNRKQSNKNPLCNNMVQMQKQYPCVQSDDRWLPPLVQCPCISPRISSVRPLEQPVITECKCPVQILDPKPSFPSYSDKHDISVQKKQQKSSPSHNSNIKETKKKKKGFLAQKKKKLNATRSTHTPNTSNPRLSLKRSTNIQHKLSNLRCSVIARTSKQTLSPQPRLNISKQTTDQKISTQSYSNILETKDPNNPIQVSLNIPETKKHFKNVKLSCELISGKGDSSSNKPRRCHLKPSTQAVVTGKGDNSLSFNDKRDLIKMCSKRKVELTPSLVKCLSDSFDLVNRRKHYPRIIEHIKFEKGSKQNKRHRITPERNATTKFSKATGIEEENARTQINKPTRHDNIKSEKGMGDAGQFIQNDCKCKWDIIKARKNKPLNSSKIHPRKISERKILKVQHIPDKKSVRKRPVKKRIVKRKQVSKKFVKSSKKKSSIFPEYRKESQCSNMYIATLRKRPWFWIYKLLPKYYPSFLRLRLCSKTICIQCAFSLTCCFWAPFAIVCFICLQLINCCQ